MRSMFPRILSILPIIPLVMLRISSSRLLTSQNPIPPRIQIATVYHDHHLCFRSSTSIRSCSVNAGTDFFFRISLLPFNWLFSPCPTGGRGRAAYALAGLFVLRGLSVVHQAHDVGLDFLLFERRERAERLTNIFQGFYGYKLLFQIFTSRLNL